MLARHRMPRDDGLMHWGCGLSGTRLRTLKAAMRTSPWVGLTSPEALESLSSRFCRTAAAAASSRSFASILLTPSTYRRDSPHIRQKSSVSEGSRGCASKVVQTSGQFEARNSTLLLLRPGRLCQLAGEGSGYGWCLSS